MKGRHGQRDAIRHWLPSQGVDPGPLAELNAECLGLLATRAAEAGDSAGLPSLLLELRELWAELPALAVRRLAAAPYSLLDAGFTASPRWLLAPVGGVREQSHPAKPPFFDAAAARSLTRRMLVYGWHLARSRPRAACLVFGATLPAVEALAGCSLATLEAAADRNADSLRPRWAQQHLYWRELLQAAGQGADERLHELLLGGLQRLAADTLEAQSS